MGQDGDGYTCCCYSRTSHRHHTQLTLSQESKGDWTMTVMKKMVLLKHHEQQQH